MTTFSTALILFLTASSLLGTPSIVLNAANTTFNVGGGAFRDSTLLRMLNAGQRDQVPAQLRRWNKVSGTVVRGLINRREKEISLWNTPIMA